MSNDPIPTLFPITLAISLDDTDVRKGQGGAFKAFELACGYKRKDICPTNGDKLGDGNVVCSENFHNNFGQGESETMF